MTHNLLLLLHVTASLASQPTTVANPVFSTYSATEKPASTAKAATSIKAVQGKQILRLDVLEATERLQEQNPKRGSHP